jgi:hypothetical protein
LGTHKHRDDNKRRGGARGGGGGGSYGGAGGSGGSGDESVNNEGKKQFETYRKSADTRIDSFLQEKKFSQASYLATNVAFRSIPTDEIASVLLAGIAALKEGKRKEWQPKAEDIARTAIESSSSIIKYQFSKENKAIVTEVLVKEIKKAAGVTS